MRRRKMLENRVLVSPIEIIGQRDRITWPGPDDSLNTMILSASGYGSGRSRTALTMLKMAVLAPIPSASVRTATNVNPGDLRSWRRASVRSFISFGTKRDNWINPQCAACGQETGDQSY